MLLQPAKSHKRRGSPGTSTSVPLSFNPAQKYNKSMGCAFSAPESGKSRASSLNLRAMTAGELKEYQRPHGQTVEGALARAQEEMEQTKKRSVWDYYGPETVLIGKGGFARVFKAAAIATGEPVAIKVVGRTTMGFEQQRRAMTTVIATMRILQGHRNMMDLYEVFEDGEGYHMVMEFVPGKPLFDYIGDKTTCFSECEAAIIMQQLLEFLAHAHALNVAHRDIKPENLILLDPPAATATSDPELQPLPGAGEPAAGASLADAQQQQQQQQEGVRHSSQQLRLKVIDFGTAGFCEPSQHMHSRVGTAQYVAPEVVDRSYDLSSDIWSAGVVMYMLLGGRPPFKARTKTGTIRLVKAGKYSLEGEAWAQVSDSAKHMLSCMMALQPGNRWSATRLLQHPWFKEALGG